MSSLNWSQPDPSRGRPSPTDSTTIPALRPTPPTSGRSTPLTSSQHPTPKSVNLANDSFSNLVSFSGSASQKNLSLLEQQKLLAEQRSQKQENSGASRSDKIWTGDDQFWNNLGSGRSTPAVPGTAEHTTRTTHRSTGHDRIESTEDDDPFAAFNASPQHVRNINAERPAVPPTASSKPSATGSISNAAGHTLPKDDDDPFGLNEFTSKQDRQKIQARATINDDDDVLGLLGRPAENLPQSQVKDDHATATEANAHPQDKAVAELVDMGFPTEKARRALEHTESGVDVQAAVGWLLSQAHAEAKDRSRPRNADVPIESHPRGIVGSTGLGRSRNGARSRDEFQEDMRPQRSQKQGESSPQRDKDPAQLASEIGSNFLKTANSFWKQSTKKVQLAYQEFSSDSDSTQPKWMRGPPERNAPRSRPSQDVNGPERAPVAPQRPAVSPPSVTDEALMLESNGPPPRQHLRRREETRTGTSVDSSRDHSPVVPSRLRESTQLSVPSSRPPPMSANSGSRTKLTQHSVEEQASQAYVSSARRRRTPGLPTASVTSQSEGDLLDAVSKRSNSFKPTNLPSRPVTKPAAPIVVRPSAPTRPVPPISDIALKASHTHRDAGNAHFKRGDYSAAHQSYTTSLSHLPPIHPITIVLLTNRALTALKTGEPKAAIADADKAISIIGPSNGESETLDMRTGDTPKPMREYYGKALMRKAEALEQMEKWREASLIWREAVEAGHGGAPAIQARARCEKAASPDAVSHSASAPPKPSARPTPRTTPRRSARAPSANSSSTPPPAAAAAAAVSRLRATHNAQAAEDDAKFRLSDSVSGRIQAWRAGKADNLRALLASLDTVLWAEAGWKKVSMADLVLPGRVKVVYMRGIGKCHPDKVCCCGRLSFFSFLLGPPLS